MQLDKDYVINQEYLAIVSSVVTCEICKELIYEPIQCDSCQNCFCNECIKEWTKQNDKCPFNCPSPQYRESRLMKCILDKLIFKCKNGCEEKIPYSELDKHYNEECDKLDFRTKYFELSAKYKELEQKNKLAFGDNAKDDYNSWQICSIHHQHHLVKCCLKDSRKEWTCCNCMQKYDGDTFSNYCSVCDFDLCDKCV